MDIGYIVDHKIKPPFVAGQDYEAKVVAVEDKDSGFTVEVTFDKLSIPGFWHFNVALVTAEMLAGLTEEEQRKKHTTKRIADDELKGIVDQLGEAITDSQQLVGKTLNVRLLSQSDSTLPSLALPIASKKGNKLVI